MAYSFLIFDFAGNEDAAQQARHRIEGWRQAFRLDKKLQFKFDRKGVPSNREDGSESTANAKPAKGRSAKAGKAKSKSSDENDSDSKSAQASEVRLIVRLDFSDHEKLSHVRWLERIPAEEPFKAAKSRVVRPDDPEFQDTSNLFDTLDPAEKKNYSPA